MTYHAPLYRSLAEPISDGSELTLGQLIDRAALAYKRNDYRGSDNEINRKEAAWGDAYDALLSHLTGKLGLTPERISELGGLL